MKLKIICKTDKHSMVKELYFIDAKTRRRIKNLSIKSVFTNQLPGDCREVFVTIKAFADELEIENK